MGHHQRTAICFQYNKSGTCRFGSSCKFSHEGSKKAATSKQPREWVEGKHRGQAVSVDYIDKFFAQHPGFDYDPSAPIWMEFNRMCDDYEWDSDDYEFRNARRNFKSAMVQQFNSLYGTDENDLSSWQNLCRILGIQPVPERLKDCRKVCTPWFREYGQRFCETAETNSRKRIRQTHVNLVDLVDTSRTGMPVNIFPNLKKLQDYTIKTEKYFPKEDAYAGSLLRFLLREILQSHTAGSGL